jgi:hypothetical protein
MNYRINDSQKPAIPFDIVPNLSLPPSKAVGAEFSARAGFAANILAAPRRFRLF